MSEQDLLVYIDRQGKAIRDLVEVVKSINERLSQIEKEMAIHTTLGTKSCKL